MKTILTLATLLASSITATLGTVHVANAQPAVRTVAVSYADLDLAAPAGQRALDVRIRNAVRELCGTASAADLAGQNRVADCRDELTARAALQRDTAIAAARTGFDLAAARR